MSSKEHKGFHAIQAALEAGQVAADVSPMPLAGRNAEFITVTTNPEPPPEQVLNALGEAGLTAMTAAQQAAYNERYPTVTDSLIALLALN